MTPLFERVIITINQRLNIGRGELAKAAFKYRSFLLTDGHPSKGLSHISQTAILSRT